MTPAVINNSDESASALIWLAGIIPGMVIGSIVGAIRKPSQIHGNLENYLMIRSRIAEYQYIPTDP